MAFKLIREGIGVNMLGRDIGRGLSNVCKKLCKDMTTPLGDFMPLLIDWKERELSIAEVNQDANKAEGVTDKFECIMAVAEAKKPATLSELVNELSFLFAKDSGLVTLATAVVQWLRN